MARLRLAPKLVALGLIALASAGDVAARIAGIEGWSGRLFYVGLLGAAWAGLLAAAWTRPTWLRWAYALLFAAGTLYVEVYIRAARAYLTYDIHISLLRSANGLGDAVSQNSVAFVWAGLLALTVALAIGLGPVRARTVPGLSLGLPLVVALVTGVMFLRGGDGGKGLPAGYTGIAYTALERFETLGGGLGERRNVVIRRSSPPLYGKIVLLIDESIAATYLDTGGVPGAVATPLTQQHQGLAIANFGIVAAITNCSVGTNDTLRFAGTRRDYLTQIATAPSLWAYAKAAGMRTVYFDGQRTAGPARDALTLEENGGLDRFVQFPDVPVMHRDMAIADALVRELADPRPAFIIVNKVGAHFPVQDKFPGNFAIDRPIPARGNYVGISDTGTRRGFDGSAESWRLYRNAYRNTLRWNVGEFFRRLLARGKLDDALIVYTSDHGQDLHQDGRPGTTTHCQAEPVMAEGAVPLVVIAPERGALRLTGTTPASHYRIGPTLLAAMGYDRAAVRDTYGLALDEGGSDPGTFNTAFNARLGRKPVWRKVDPAQLPGPPAGDTAPR